jgi:hypothetical protein
MPNKQTMTDQIVWLLMQAAIVQDEIKKIKQQLQELQEYKEPQKRSCRAEANDVCRTPPTMRIGGGPRSRSPSFSPTTPPTPPTKPPFHSPPAPPSTRAILESLLQRTPPRPLTSPLTSFTVDEILEALSPSFDIERELKLLEERAKRSKRA